MNMLQIISFLSLARKWRKKRKRDEIPEKNLNRDISETSVIIDMKLHYLLLIKKIVMIKLDVSLFIHSYKRSRWLSSKLDVKLSK